MSSSRLKKYQFKFQIVTSKTVKPMKMLNLRSKWLKREAHQKAVRHKVMLWDHLPGVDFIKVKSWAQIIEIALSICALGLRPTFTPLKNFSKVGRRARIGHKKFMKSTPGLVTFTRRRCKPSKLYVLPFASSLPLWSDVHWHRRREYVFVFVMVKFLYGWYYGYSLNFSQTIWNRIVKKSEF